MVSNNKILTPEESNALLALIKSRIDKNRFSHQKLSWDLLAQQLLAKPNQLWSLGEMERTGGEPDLVYYDEKNQAYTFVDCAAESPTGRRSICYDDEALQSRKEHKPKNSAIQMAKDMGVSILTETQYRNLQQKGVFDLKTSSWITTPQEIRNKGGALFCDRRYDHVFVYHNGAESYYAARGFRAMLNFKKFNEEIETP